jgi:hypothetical protein
MENTEKNENIFDINHILKDEYQAFKDIIKQKNIELLFEMGKCIPRKLKGDEIAFRRFLTALLDFILDNTSQKEILLSLDAPEDFLVEEFISFKIDKIGISKEKVLAFLKTDLDDILTFLDGKIVYSSTIDIQIDIPFAIAELGHRRHYRLPKTSMLNKKVLIVAKSENITRSIATMMKYFPYDVDIALTASKEDIYNFVQYDLVIIEDNFLSETFTAEMKEMQQKKDIKYVLICDDETLNIHKKDMMSTYLVKPITQESIFELIISVFEDENVVPENTNDAHVSDILPSTIEKTNDDSNHLSQMIEKNKVKQPLVLDTDVGIEHANKYGLDYKEELKSYLDIFEGSDLYFRQIVNEKQSNKIKEFCIDLEKKSKDIGAESMEKFSNIVNFIFVYNKLDMLPIYPGRYHIELEKLISEIKKYLATV